MSPEPAAAPASDITVGEIYRLLTGVTADLKQLTTNLAAHQTDVQNKHAQIIDRVQGALGPMGELKVRVGRVEDDVNKLGTKHDTDTLEIKRTLEKLEEKVDSVVTNAARVTGAIGLATFLASIIPWQWPWKH